MQRSPTLRMRVKGDWAMFTRPELKSERVTYPVMTPSAARGVLEAILWKPAMRWRVERIHVLNDIRFSTIRRNEVNTKISPPKQDIIEEGGPLWRYFADDDRAQRFTIALRDVDYVIEACIEMTRRAGPEDNLTKFVEMFNRRLEKGQHYHQPYLGCRECVAAFEPVEKIPAIRNPVTRDLGLMLWDIEYSGKQRRPRFFRARLENSVLEVPEDPEATLAALGEESAA
jgi:CRISPR-associated protein Cas5d